MVPVESESQKAGKSTELDKMLLEMWIVPPHSGVVSHTQQVQFRSHRWWCGLLRHRPDLRRNGPMHIG